MTNPTFKSANLDRGTALSEIAETLEEGRPVEPTSSLDLPAPTPWAEPTPA